ncbi:type III-A CRISPR-associated protein Cas10/Csm1 [Bacteroides sp.]
MNAIREHIYLAALLHDIGKFYQRADTGDIASSKRLTSPIKELENVILPLHDRVRTYKHCLWTAQFIEDYKVVFHKLVDNEPTNLTEDKLINLAAKHHLPSEQLSLYENIIKKADALSSGIDRDDEKALKDDLDEREWEIFRKKKMTSILQSIKGHQGNDSYYLPLTKLTLTKDFFPNLQSDEPDYVFLWNNFEKDFKFIQANTYRAFSETLLNLLYNYTTTVPTSTVNSPDVSLYDHLKTTAALAVCLYDYEQSEKNSNSPFLLIGADFSGIQSYIYQIVSKYASKNLKGRSFYLRILSDTIVRFLLKELHLFQANIIYNSGGGFYILAPNTKNTKERLEQAILKIEKELFNAHGTALYVAIDAIEMSEDVLMHHNSQNLGIAWKELFEKRDQKKFKKFSSVVQNDYRKVFSPSMHGGEYKRDSITGEEMTEKEIRLSEKESSTESQVMYLKETTRKQIELGRFLRNSDIMMVAEQEIACCRDKVGIAPANLGFHYYFLKRSDLNKIEKELQILADKVTLVSLNGQNLSCDFMLQVDGINNIHALEFYGGNIYEENTFSDMCDNNSFERLGVLRMDVDNLGSIFQSGIAPQDATLSRYSALSRSFDYFFSGYLNTIQQEVSPKNSFIVYSGGDDVFIVGGWDHTIALAKRIHSDFKKFTCYNPAFSISGGIAILPDTYPIMKGAKESADEESNAKKHFIKDEETNGYYEKNSISFMNTPLNWGKEFPTVESLKNNIVTFIKNENLPKSFISKIISHAMNAQIKAHKIMNMKTFWIITYDLVRLKSTVKDSDCKELIDRCIKEVCGHKGTLNGKRIETSYHPLELWTFAARWAELETRNKNQQII